MTTWRDLWRPPVLGGGERAEQAGMTYVLLRAGAVLIAAGLALSFALRPLPLDGHAAYALMLLVHVLGLTLVRRGAVRTAIIGFSVTCIGIMVMAMVRAGGTVAPAGFVLPPLVMFVGLALGGRGALVTAGVASVAVLAVIGVEGQGWLADAANITPVRIWLVSTTSLVITGVMLHAALRIIRDSRARAAAELARRQEIEERLLQHRRLEAVGRLAAGVAHDFNNVLTVVFAEVSRLSRSDARTAASAANIKEAAERAAALTRQLLSFGRKQVRDPESLELAEVTRELASLLGKFVGEDIRLVIAPDDHGPPVRADRTELEQVLLNLVTNARDAMPDGGVLTLCTGRASPELRARFPQITGADAAFLSVADTGTGIEPEVKSRLFDPFFTTKPIGKGTGLGLATVHAIVTAASGGVAVDSEPGKGTTFTVLLPAAKGSAPMRAVSPIFVLPAARHADIVVVDDDALVRDAMTAMVLEGGHTVTAVGTAAEALEAAAHAPRPLDLLVTDVVMADMAGPELARRMRELHPGLRVLFTSGHAEDRLSERGMVVEGVHFVAKPFERTRLLDKIAAVLASDSPGRIGRA